MLGVSASATNPPNRPKEAADVSCCSGPTRAWLRAA